MSDRDSQINFTIEREAKELAKDRLEHGELSTILRRRVHEVAFGEEVSRHTRLEQRLASLRDRKDELRSERRGIEAAIEDVEQKITRVEEQMGQLDKREDRYEAALEMLEETIYGGTRVDPGHGQVEKAAKIGQCDPSDVIDDLQERNPSVPEHAFVQSMHSDREWPGLQEGRR